MNTQCTFRGDYLLLEKQNKENVRALKFIRCFEGSIKNKNFYYIDDLFFKMLILYVNNQRYVVNDISKDQFILEVELDLVLLFEYLFVKYETPVLLIENIFLFNSVQVDFIIQLLHNKDVRKHSALSVPLLRKEVFYLKKIPVDIPIKSFNQLLLIAKLISNGITEKIVTEFLTWFELNITDYSLVIENSWVFVLRFLSRLNVEDKNLGYYLDYFVCKINENPNYTCNKTSIQSINKEIEKWHLQLQKVKSPEYYLSWLPRNICNRFFLDENEYVLSRLSSGKDLYLEGKQLNHCVFSYTKKCYLGFIEIWSIRQADNFRFTVEVKDNVVVQIKGKHNRSPRVLERQILTTLFYKMKWKVSDSLV